MGVYARLGVDNFEEGYDDLELEWKRIMKNAAEPEVVGERTSPTAKTRVTLSRPRRASWQPLALKHGGQSAGQ